jgi:hypothetical protein
MTSLPQGEGGIKDFVTTVKKVLILKSVAMEEGGIKIDSKMRDVIEDDPLVIQRLILY